MFYLGILGSGSGSGSEMLHSASDKVGSCEHRDHSGSIKHGEFLDCVMYIILSKKVDDSVMIF